MKEYRVDIKIKNNLLLSAIENAGFQSIAEFCREANILMSSVHALIGLKESPLRQDGTYTVAAQKLLDYFCALPEDLWTEDQLWNTLATNKGRVLLDKHQMSVLTYGGEEEVLALEDMIQKKEIQEKVNDMLQTLTPREEKLLKMRFGLNGMEQHTLEETGQAFDVSRERVRQIERKGLTKLRHPQRLDKIRDCLGEDTESGRRLGSWNIFVARKKPPKEDLDACQHAFFDAYDRASKSTPTKPLSRAAFWDAYRYFHKIPNGYADTNPAITLAYHEGWKQGLKYDQN